MARLSILRPILFLVVSLTLLTSCGKEEKKDDPTPLTPEEQLPPITQEGKNTFAFLLDGELWQPARDLSNNIEYAVVIDSRLLGATGNVLRIIGKKNDTRDAQGLTVYGHTASIILATVPSSPSTYTLEAPNLAPGLHFPDFSHSYFSYKDEKLDYSAYFYTLKPYSGKVTISRMDAVNRIIAGQFEADVVNQIGAVHKITKGRFDLKY